MSNHTVVIPKSVPDAESAVGAYIFQPDWTEMGINFQKQGNLQAAAKAFLKAAEEHPDNPTALSNLALVMFELKHYIPALVLLKKSLQLDSGNADAHNNVAVILRALQDWAGMRKSLQTAIQIQPTHIQAVNNYASLLHLQGQSERAVSYLKTIIDKAECPDVAHMNYLFALNSVPKLSNNYVRMEHVQYAKQPDSQRGFLFRKNPPPTTLRDGEPLRVGYISPDLHCHSVAYFLEALLRDSTTAVEVYVYSMGDGTDLYTKKLQRYVAPQRWYNGADKTHYEVAQKIADDRIHILVDLIGHTQGSAPEVLNLKPAPVIASYLGYNNTTGMKSVDYYITDRWMSRLCQDAFTEVLVYLPTFVCYTPPDDTPPVAPAPYKRNGYVTFGSFNAMFKMNEQVFETWAKLLALTTADNTHLYLKSNILGDKETRDYWVSRFTKLGISEDRLRLEGWKGRVDHFASYNDVDLALDTFPYNGTTTTCEALWMGVPVLSLACNRPAGNVGLSLLNTIKLPELCTESIDAYIQYAMNCVNNPTVLDNRQDMRTRVKAGLCDGRQFNRSMESVYHLMWQETGVNA